MRIVTNPQRDWCERRFPCWCLGKGLSRGLGLVNLRRLHKLFQEGERSRVLLTEGRQPQPPAQCLHILLFLIMLNRQSFAVQPCPQPLSSRQGRSPQSAKQSQSISSSRSPSAILIRSVVEKSTKSLSSCFVPPSLFPKDLTRPAVPSTTAVAEAEKVLRQWLV